MNDYNVQEVTIKEIHLLLDKVKAIHDAGHYLMFAFSHYINDIYIYFKKDGIDSDSQVVYQTDFSLGTDNDDRAKYQMVMSYLNKVLEGEV